MYSFDVIKCENINFIDDKKLHIFWGSESLSKKKRKRKDKQLVMDVFQYFLTLQTKQFIIII